MIDKAERKTRRYAATQKWRRKNIEKVRASVRARYWRNREKFLAAGAKWREENREKSRSASRNWQNSNREKFKSDHAAWRVKNSHRRSSAQALRNAVKAKASPVWANQFFISETYHLAALRTKMLGFKWHVDHIVPLQSKRVCGLHVENNLRVIPAFDNISKSNRTWPGMP